MDSNTTDDMDGNGKAGADLKKIVESVQYRHDCSLPHSSFSMDCPTVQYKDLIQNLNKENQFLMSKRAKCSNVKCPKEQNVPISNVQK